jgi:hypothetical protein
MSGAGRTWRWARERLMLNIDEIVQDIEQIVMVRNSTDRERSP